VFCHQCTGRSCFMPGLGSWKTSRNSNSHLKQCISWGLGDSVELMQGLCGGGGGCCLRKTVLMSISCRTVPWCTQQRILLVSYMISFMTQWFRIMVSVLWSPDLNPCCFYLWCMPTHKVSVNSYVSLQDLKENIWQEILALNREHISHTFTYFLKV
jgi:hypothetical protein